MSCPARFPTGRNRRQQCHGNACCNRAGFRRWAGADALHFAELPVKIFVPADQCGRQIQQAARHPRINCRAADFKPFLGPSNLWVWTVPVPNARQENENIPALEQMMPCPPFYLSAALRNHNELQRVEYTSAFPTEGAILGMILGRIGLSGCNTCMPDGRDLQSPCGFAGAYSEIFEKVADRDLQ